MVKNSICVICGSSIHGDESEERLHLCRCFKNIKGLKETESITVGLPVCKSCHHKYHPYEKRLIIVFASISALAPLCVLFSLIQKETFSISPLAGVISFLLAGLFLYGAICLCFSLAIMFCFDAFAPSLKAEPYRRLTVVQKLIEYGFVDEKDYRDTTALVSSGPSLNVISEELKNKYSCNIEIWHDDETA